MNRPVLYLLALTAAIVTFTGVEAAAQCPVTELTSGLLRPLGITRSNQGNLLVSDAGTPAPNTGRISIVDLGGHRRTLLTGLPSGINYENNQPSGPAGLFLRGRTLYVAIGVGNAVAAGPFPGTTVQNPNPSTPLLSSVLALHFSAHVEKTTDGFTLTLADHQAIAGGERVTLSNGGGDHVAVELIANFPDFTPSPLPFFPGNVRHANPFDLTAIDNHLYVTDGGRNLVWQVDIPTGAFSALTAFPPIPNPLPFGPPVVEAVPTGITDSDGQLLVTLFRGFPFPAGASTVVQVDPRTGDHTPVITGLKTAIDVLPIRKGGDTDHLVLQHTTGPILSGPGLLLRFETLGSPPTVIANCLNSPTSMVIDEKTGTLYIAELFTGRIVRIPVVQPTTL